MCIIKEKIRPIYQKRGASESKPNPKTIKLKQNFTPFGKKKRYRMIGKADFISQLDSPIEDLQYKNGYLRKKSEQSDFHGNGPTRNHHKERSSMQHTQSCKNNQFSMTFQWTQR